MSIDAEEKTIKAWVEAEKQDTLIHLSTGVVLRGKQANATHLISIMAAFPRPKPPEVRNERMGRVMENPDDPDYKSRVQAWQMEMGDAILTAFILLGTELVSKPDDMLGYMPEKNGDFLETYSLLNLPMRPDSKQWRYIAWVKTVACQSAEDPKLIQEMVGRLSGVSRKDVAAAEEFPGS